MIVQYRPYPLRAILEKILLSRIIKNHCMRPIIEVDFHREDSGHWGEAALDYYLSFLPQEKYYIFQHLRLKYEQWTFQIDFLLITTHFALIIEAKNYAGTINFESKFNQVIQTHNDKEKGYDDPIAQAERQQRLLKKWLEKYLGRSLPIDYLVVMSNTKAILKTDSDEIPKKVCKPYKLINKIEEIESLYPTKRIDKKVLNKLCELLLEHHIPEQCDILAEYKLSKKDILTGVVCPTCGSLPMVYKRGKWYCIKCNTSSKDAHLTNLNHYFLLVKPYITNAEFKEFLHLSSGNVAQKLLSNLNLPSTGRTKDRVYYQKGSEINEIHCPGRQADCCEEQS